jgi:hypothetical protein
MTVKLFGVVEDYQNVTSGTLNLECTNSQFI